MYPTGSLYEGGIHVPAFLYSASRSLLPSQLRRIVSTETMHVTDWLPTIETIVSNKDTGNPFSGYGRSSLDGIDMWPRFLDGGQCHQHFRQAGEGVHDDNLRPCQASRVHNRTVLLNHDPYYEGSALLDGDWKLIVHHR